MKVHRLALFGIGFIGVVIIALSMAFYYIERMVTLNAVADGLNQNLYYVENDLKRVLQTNRFSDIQETLDQAVGVNKSLAELSLSLDGRHLTYSSSRARIGQELHGNYVSVAQLYKGIVEYKDALFRTSLTYYDGEHKKQAWLFAGIDKDYVFGRMNQVAIMYGIGLFIALALMSGLVFELVRRAIVIPLEHMAHKVRSASVKTKDFFIQEFADLDRTLSETFLSLHQQHSDLKTAYENARYLDGILRTIADVNQVLITAKTVDELMVKSTERLASHPGNAFCWIGLARQGVIELSACSNADATIDLQPHQILAVLDADESLDPVVNAFRLGKAKFAEQLSVPDGEEEMRAIWRTIAQQAGYGAFVALPLRPSVHEDPIGVLGLYTHREAGFDLKEISMLEDLSGDIAFAIQAFERRVQLEHHLTTDSNTGLPNRVALIEYLNRSSSGLLAIINIDRFSDINAVYGITIGDALLVAYAQWLLRMIAPLKNVTLYKLGGDEFALLQTDAHQIEPFRKFLDHLVVETARSSFTLADIDVIMTVSIGMAYVSDQGLPHATAALKQAKMSHQSVRIYEGASSTQEQENNIAWYKRIKQAIEQSRIVPYYQPIVDNKTRRIVKYEALMRLIETDGQIVSPYVFLEIAKKTKLYTHLTRMMIDQVFNELQRCALPISVNLSAEDLSDDKLADYLEHQISLRQIGSRLIFEILESEGIHNYESVRAFILRFKSLGCQFAIDDFGAGYSNFDHLIKLNMDVLKIDGSLIRNLPHDRNTQIIVKHICDFAHEMGVTTVAEFVTNEAIYKWVVRFGIDTSQGYYFYEPAADLPVRDEIESSAL
ncbi:hypothetical protein A9404_02235 [Halothiobacillus diazotrophicus]|uniref:Diguanylate cyclase n=1 Tax=Halothiobacillus diazotrophicus TaxID=1860122 RepID=A0A191ZEQ8_9GAMM|nr:EAL domain-containing protein [Halothiobacillus diazotrophicus]ANJ66354.1 hypothetical protein A9404_02235 [Halothiobacillus diazotrophicus]